MPATIDRATHRALVEAGYAPLAEYVARYAPVTPAPIERGFDPAQDGGKPDARRVTRAVSPLHSATDTSKGR